MGLAGVLWVLNLGRTWLFLFPGSVQVEADSPAEHMALPPELAPLAHQLQALGFVPLGSHEERPRLRPPLCAYAFAHPHQPVFATLYPGPPRLELLTPLAPEGFVITANWRRPALERPGRYRSGGLADASPERLLRAHLRRLRGLTPGGDFSWEARVSAAQAWYQGLGRGEVRQQNLPGLLWTATALAIFATALLGLSRPA